MKACLTALLLLVGGCASYEAKERSLLTTDADKCLVAVCPSYGRIKTNRDCRCVTRYPGH